MSQKDDGVQNWREKFSVYSMHESIIRKIKCEDGKLTLVFSPEDGYSLFNREKGILEPPVHNAVMEFRMDGLTEDEAECCLELVLLKKKRVKYIDFPTLCKMLEKDRFRVHEEYFTYLEDVLLITGHIGQYGLACKLRSIDGVIFKAREESR